MMGMQVLDPDREEGDVELMPGLGLLPVVTRITGEKVTRRVTFCREGDEATPLEGYEIHMGVTLPQDGATLQPLNRMQGGEPEGCRVDDRCMGTYIHGILDNPSFVDFLLRPHADRWTTEEAAAFDYHRFKEEQYDLLADHVRRHVNLPLVYQILTHDDD